MIQFFKGLGILKVPADRYGRFYVYELIDPRSGRPFYVGKGTKDRMLAHEKATKAILKKGRKMMLKCLHKKIIEIWDAGLEVGYNVLYRTDDEELAYQEESKRINAIGLERLMNATYGYRPKAKRTPHR